MKLKFVKVEINDRNCYYDVFNNKKELLGYIDYNYDWKKWDWEQKQDIIMSSDCLQQIIDFMKTLEKKK